MDIKTKNSIKFDYIRYGKRYSHVNLVKELLINRAFRYSTLLRLSRYYINTRNKTMYRILKVILRFNFINRLSEISPFTDIGDGLYIGHFSSITINKNAVIGKNVNIHKGVTIGQENRGSKVGAPIIGNRVWIGINATSDYICNII